MMGDDHRMTRCIADAGVETDRLQVVHQPFGRPPAFVVIGGIGRDRLDPQQLEQSLQALVEIAVETVEDGGQRGHGWILLELSGGYNNPAAKETPVKRKRQAAPRSLLRQGARLLAEPGRL